MRSIQAAKWLAVALAVGFSGASSIAAADDAAKAEEPADSGKRKNSSDDPTSDDKKRKTSESKDGTDESDRSDASHKSEGADKSEGVGKPASEDNASDEDADPSDDAVAEEDDDDESESPPVARDDEPMVLLETDDVLRIKARRARLRRSAYERLHAIAERYHEATNRKLVVTGGGRKPGRQAELMHDMMRDGKNLLHLYVQVTLVRPLIKTYEEGKKKRWGRRRTVAAMTKIIDEQVKKGRYVSRHLAHTAADVRSRGLTDEHVEALKEAVTEVKGARLVDERNGNAPHFHLSL